MILTCSGILFDLDGVLVDSTGAVARVWRTWAGRYGLDSERVIREAHGRRSIESIRALAPQLDAERENEIVEAMEIADQDGVVALPGAAQLLSRLPQAQHAIVTSATRALAVARMGHAGLPIPQYFVSADDVSEGKPSPRPYLQGAALLKLEPRECLVIEDAPAGVESAQRAGMRVIGLTTTFSAKDLGAADAIVRSLAEVSAEITAGLIRLRIDGQS